MSIEITSTISGLDLALPLDTDPVSEGNNHLQLIKSVLQTQFPGVNGDGFNIPITSNEEELNNLIGSRNNIQNQIDNIVSGAGGFLQLIGGTMSGTINMGSSLGSYPQLNFQYTDISTTQKGYFGYDGTDLVLSTTDSTDLSIGTSSTERLSIDGITGVITSVSNINIDNSSLNLVQTGTSTAKIEMYLEDNAGALTGVINGIGGVADNTNVAIRANGNDMIYVSGDADFINLRAKTAIEDTAIGKSTYLGDPSNYIEIGELATGDRYSHIDFHTNDTESDYSLRIISDSGVDTNSSIQHSG
ncbi:MAG: hypothetical protein DRP42_06410, partial [Tenericutes bacterium]